MKNKTEHQSLVDVLCHHAMTQSDKRIYTLLSDGERNEAHLTFRDLDLQARSLAVRLTSIVKPGERALLLYPTSLEYLTAFFGCLYAGIVPVPAFPPRLNRIDQRILAIAKNAQATIALTTPEILAGIERRSNQMPELKTLDWFGTQHPEFLDGFEYWKKPDLSGDSLAFIQYTSGSTATPKGVLVSHGNLIHNLSSIQTSFQIDPSNDDVGVSWSPLYHDSGLILSALLAVFAGVHLFVMSPSAFAQKPARWLDAISRYKGTISGGPNFAFDWCVDRITPEERASLDLSNWRLAFTGGEPIRSETMKRFTRTFAPCGFRSEAITPLYGLAESTLMISSKYQSKHYSTYFLDRPNLEKGIVLETDPQTEAVREFIGCGQILTGQEVVIVDPDRLIQVPSDRVGEIWVSSSSVALGYWGNGIETTTKFHARLPHLGDRSFLRTGDLGFIKNGELVITGRLKDVIIINGRNFYAEDIERTLRDIHPALQLDSGAAFSIEIDGMERLVIVYEVKREYRHANTEEIARIIRRAIAENHELAVHDIVLIKPLSMPRTTSNKIQRSVCKAEYLSNHLERIGHNEQEGHLANQEGFSAIEPRTPVEASLCFIWAEVLGINKVAVDDNFFELGGTSLIATQIASRVEDFFHVELPLSILFETPTVAHLADLIEKKTLQGSLQESNPILLADHSVPTPCSFAQERMWFLHQLDPSGSAYNLPVAVRLVGTLNLQALESSFRSILERHESLRTTFVLVEDQPFQVVKPYSPELLDEIFEHFKLIENPANGRERIAHQIVNEEIRKPFSLGSELPFRLRLIELSDKEHILVINMHHIVGDAWSINQLVREFLIHYNGSTSGLKATLPGLPVQYVDYSTWQRQRFNNGVLKKELSYWRHQLTDVPILELPTDHQRPDVQTYRGSVELLDINDSLLEKLRILSRNNEVTLFMTFLAAFSILLNRYSGLEDIAIGVPVANRNRLETEQLIGILVNTIVMRLNIDNDVTFEQLLRQVKKTSLEAYDHQELPFSKLISELQPIRDTRHTPITQVLFNLIDVQTPPLKLNDLEIEPLRIDRGGAQFDLTMSITDLPTERSIALEYNTDLFEQVTIARMMDHFVHLLNDIVNRGNRPISQLNILSETELNQLLKEWNDTARDDRTERSLPDLFEAQVSKTPDAVAVVYGGEQLTYAELNRQANRLAHHLIDLGTKPGKLIGIHLHRSPDILIAILAVLKAGGAYVPLDPTFPAARLAYQIQDAEIGQLITTTRLDGSLPVDGIQIIHIDKDGGTIPDDCYENPGRIVRPSDLVYVIYTSGSTGKPKGVKITHQAVANFLLSMAERPGIDENDILLAVTTISFDIAVLELWLPLIVGAQVVIAGRELSQDGQGLIRMISEQDVTMMQATPVTFELMLESGWRDADGLKILCGGEALRDDLARRLLSIGVDLWNMYGPTETTIWSSIQHVRSMDEEISIGRPIANTEMYILDKHLNPVPIGVPGILFIGGKGVSPGYQNLPELTKEKFIPHPFKPAGGELIYDTGDLACFLPDGRIKLLGRNDHQVKIRGYRIELGEIEAVLNEHPAVKKAILSTVANGNQGRSLAAYIVYNNGNRPDSNEVKIFLKKRLPDYMVPVSIVPISSIPLTPNGKVNYKALPAPQSVDDRETISPRSYVEKELLNIWEQVLSIHPIGIRNNFFDLGGHSLLAIRLLNRIGAVFGINLPIATIFQFPTIEEMAQVVQGKIAPPDWSVLIPIQREGSQRPIFCVHGAGGGIMGYVALANALGKDQPVYGLQARGVDNNQEPHQRIEEMAAAYIDQIRRFQPNGPYELAGYSFGGFVAYEMACQLKAQGQEVGLLAILDTYAMSRESALKGLWRPKNFLKFLKNLPLWIRDEFILLFVRSSRTKMIPERQHVLDAHIEALRHYQPRKYDGKISLFRVRTYSLLRSFDQDYGWGELAAGGVKNHLIPGSHFNMLEEPFVEKLADQVKLCLTVERI